MIWVVVALLWAATGHRLRVARHHGDMINCSYAGAVAALAAAATVRALKTEVDSVTGPYIGDLVEHLLVVVSGLAAQLFLLALRTGSPAGRALRVRVAIAGGVAAAMVASFVAAPIHQAVTGDLDRVYGHLPAVVAYRVVFNAQLAWVLVDNLRLCRRYVRLPGNRDRTVSLLITGYSSAVALVYPASRVLFDLIELAAGRAPALLRTVGTAAALIGVGGMAVGTLAPRVVPAVREWAEVRRGTRRLRPLWSDLTAAFPQVTLSTGLRDLDDGAGAGGEVVDELGGRPAVGGRGGVGQDGDGGGDEISAAGGLEVVQDPAGGDGGVPLEGGHDEQLVGGVDGGLPVAGADVVAGVDDQDRVEAGEHGAEAVERGSVDFDHPVGLGVGGEDVEPGVALGVQVGGEVPDAGVGVFEAVEVGEQVPHGPPAGVLESAQCEGAAGLVVVPGEGRSAVAAEGGGGEQCGGGLPGAALGVDHDDGPRTGQASLD